MQDRRPGSRQAVAFLVVSLAATGILAALAWVLDPEVARIRLSDDGKFGPVTEEWLRLYSRAALVLVALVGGVTAVGLLRRRALEGLVARHPLALPRLALAGGALILGLLGAEFGLRAAGLGIGETSTNSAAYREYAHRFHALVREQRDRRGYRETRLERPAPEGVSRILVVGDSFVFGFGVEASVDTFPAVLERELAALSGSPRCEVLNAGRMGADSAEQVAILQELLPGVAPDLVLIGYYVNDGESTAEKNAFFGSRRLLPVISDNLVRVSRLWRLCEGAITRRLENAGWRRTYIDHLLAQTAPGSQAWEEHRADLQRLLELAGRGAVFVIFPLIADYDDYPLEALHERVAAVAEEAGVPVLDLREALRGLRPDEIQAAPFDPHLNERGLAVTAAATARFLADRGLLPNSP